MRKAFTRRIGTTLYVGLSTRTDADGAAELKRLAGDLPTGLDQV